MRRTNAECSAGGEGGGRGEVGHLKSSIQHRGSRWLLRLALSSPHEILQIVFKLLCSTMLRISSPSQVEQAQPAIIPQSIINCGSCYGYSIPRLKDQRDVQDGAHTEFCVCCQPIKALVKMRERRVVGIALAGATAAPRIGVWFVQLVVCERINESWEAKVF
jgi:hypothetical protein